MVVTLSYDLKMLDKDLKRSEYEQLIIDEINRYESCKPLSTYYFIKTKTKENTAKLHAKLTKIRNDFEEEKIAEFRYVINPCVFTNEEFQFWLKTSDIKCVEKLFDIKS